MRLISSMPRAGLPRLTLCLPLLACGAPGVIPRPHIEDYGGRMIRMGDRGAGFKVSFKNSSPEESAACKEGFRLLSRRLALLGAGDTTRAEGSGEAQVAITKFSAEAFSRTLAHYGAKENVTGKRLEQAYTLVCRESRGMPGPIEISACSDVGIYYGLVSLCQILDPGGQGGVRLPAVKIADWPEIGLRLAKTSATTLPLPALQESAAWLPLYKINVMGLQFHGTDSRNPEPFPGNVKAICSRARQGGILETVVYFCPFRGNGYDFNRPADQRHYAQFLQEVLDQGAHGIEVDYNDWPGKGTPIEDVINLACRAVAERNPQAYVLYCPPSRGSSMYRGPASPEMRRILSNVPANVWPLWVGPSVRNALIEKPLDAEDVEEWTRAAGRRPFLWVNRVSPRDHRPGSRPEDHRPFSRPVSEEPGAFAFHGEFLPKDLNRLFEGVHLNAAPPSRSDPETLAYLATAADYLWNPQAWEAVESCRRAKRFTEIMAPLLEE